MINSPPRKPIDVRMVRQLMSYNSSSGILTWKQRGNRLFPNRAAANAWNGRYFGKQAGSISPTTGYMRIRLNGVMFYAHRLAWAHFYGEQPPHVIDHTNRDRADNRIINLRKSTTVDNNRNRTMQSNNTSGITGIDNVALSQVSNPWRSRIMVNGKYISKSFPCVDGAVAWRSRMMEKNGFDTTHGMPAPRPEEYQRAPLTTRTSAATPQGATSSPCLGDLDHGTMGPDWIAAQIAKADRVGRNTKGIA